MSYAAGWPFKAPHADMQARARGAVNPDEFGYWRERGPVTFLGEQYGSVGGSSYRYRDANGKVGSIDWHVYVGIDPV